MHKFTGFKMHVHIFLRSRVPSLAVSSGSITSLLLFFYIYEVFGKYILLFPAHIYFANKTILVSLESVNA